MHGPGPHVTDATHNFDRFYMKAETIKLYWNRPDFALDDHDVEAACCRALSFWRPMNAATQARRLSYDDVSLTTLHLYCLVSPW